MKVCVKFYAARTLPIKAEILKHGFGHELAAAWVTSREGRAALVMVQTSNLASFTRWTADHLGVATYQKRQRQLGRQ